MSSPTRPTPTESEQARPLAPARKERPPVLAIALIFGAMLLFLASSAPVAKHIQRWRYEGSPAPELALVALDAPTRPPVTLQAYRGKVVLLDFWATWCPPCRKQMPALQKIALDASLYDSLQILSINTDEHAPDRLANVRAFMRQNRYTMKTLLDDGSAMKAYRIQSIPTLVVISPAGEVVHLLHGVHSEEELRQIVREAGAM